MTSQAVSPRSVKVSEEVEGGDSVNEGASESNNEEQRALQEFDVDFERDSASGTPSSHFKGNSGTLRTHLHWRSWCPHGVSGRGVSSQHGHWHPGEDQVDVATAALDHCFFQSMPGEESFPVLVMVDHVKSMLSAHAVSMKGAVIE